MSACLCCVIHPPGPESKAVDVALCTRPWRGRSASRVEVMAIRVLGGQLRILSLTWMYLVLGWLDIPVGMIAWSEAQVNTNPDASDIQAGAVEMPVPRAQQGGPAAMANAETKDGTSGTAAAELHATAETKGDDGAASQADIGAVGDNPLPAAGGGVLTKLSVHLVAPVTFIVVENSQVARSRALMLTCGFGTSLRWRPCDPWGSPSGLVEISGLRSCRTMHDASELAQAARVRAASSPLKRQRAASLAAEELRIPSAERSDFIQPMTMSMTLSQHTRKPADPGDPLRANCLVSVVRDVHVSAILAVSARHCW